MQELLPTLTPLALALGLGLLVGLQREHANSPLAGFRTFPLITLSGALCAMLALTFGGWVVAMGFVTLAAMIVVGNLAEIKRESKPDHGLTTEAAMMVMYAVGAYLVVGSTTVAIIVSGVVALLLHLKPQMKSFAGRLGDQDFKAIMQFVVITMLILPLLPNQYYGPFHVLNPFKLWLMVVLIVGISLSGYIVYKFFGEKAGALTGGIMGGLISSTATTVSYSRRTRNTSENAGIAAVVVMMASAIVYGRVLLLIGTADPVFLGKSIGPLGSMLVATLVLAIVAWTQSRCEHSYMPEHANPSELKAALIFGVLFGCVLLATAAAREYVGSSGLYAVAILSGLTDMDAITLSLTEMVRQGKVEPDTAWRLIITASLSNLVFKTGVVFFLGNRRLLARISMLFGAAFVVGLLIIWLWP